VVPLARLDQARDRDTLTPHGAPPEYAEIFKTSTFHSKTRSSFVFSFPGSMEDVEKGLFRSELLIQVCHSHAVVLPYFSTTITRAYIGVQGYLYFTFLR
jgi:hypothetical protein